MKVGQVARIQEEIKEARGGRKAGYWIMGIGILIALFPFLMFLFVLILALLSDSPQPEPFASGLDNIALFLAIGFAVGIGGAVISTYYENKVKKLMQKLDQGGGG
ncbi:hypothetical protein ES703_74872 [subsurface metagenome]